MHKRVRSIARRDPRRSLSGEIDFHAAVRGAVGKRSHKPVLKGHGFSRAAKGYLFSRLQCPRVNPIRGTFGVQIGGSSSLQAAEFGEKISRWLQPRAVGNRSAGVLTHTLKPLREKPPEAPRTIYDSGD